MAKTLVVYYSLEGNIAFVAKALSEKLGADIFQLETVKAYPKKGLLKFFHGGKDVVTKVKPELKTEVPNLSDYEKIVIGTPVWASKPAAPLNTFFDKADLSGKKCYTFASSAGGNAAKCLETLKSEVEKKGGSFEGTESFQNPLGNMEAALSKIDDFSKKISIA